MKLVKSKTAPAEALKLLDQAWAYYTPEPLPVAAETPELFQYANAA
ncbi:hypothetical protein SAMN05444007_11138 [Cribrihabitans marinus]|uniref:Uncharacterized protein n=1 Tax=Cribrihabitans marinus TaxID=1227549 RepID=A0A1H7DGZ0_9RHOB|nr:hypothetical protein [Cribrihabitans marinus]GGH38755.1 hypothetical protein GCM10010973_34220 [Cribrihabitans marinus]SEK00167.1 hypothetical protein SAMN05444007_11138 [Cribrihabitans marinus]